MIKIELVRFEAQDVITASICQHENHEFTDEIVDTVEGPAYKGECKDCGETLLLFFTPEE